MWSALTSLALTSLSLSPFDPVIRPDVILAAFTVTPFTAASLRRSRVVSVGAHVDMSNTETQVALRSLSDWSGVDVTVRQWTPGQLT